MGISLYLPNSEKILIVLARENKPWNKLYGSIIIYYVLCPSLSLVHLINVNLPKDIFADFVDTSFRFTYYYYLRGAAPAPIIVTSCTSLTWIEQGI